MAQQIKVGKFPRWLRKALKAQVLTYREAEVIHKLAYLADWPEEVEAPEAWQSPLESIALLEMRGFRA